MMRSARPRSLPPAIKAPSIEPRQLDELANLIEGKTDVIAEVVCAAGARLNITPADVQLVVTLMWLTDQVPPITSDQQCNVYTEQLAAIAAKAGDVPLAQFARTIEGLLAAPTLLRIQEWDVKQKEDVSTTCQKQ